MRSSQRTDLWGGNIGHPQRNKRAFNPETRMYLHMSGRGEVKGTTYSWRGSAHQFNMLNPPNRDAYVLVEEKQVMPEYEAVTIREMPREEDLAEVGLA